MDYSFLRRVRSYSAVTLVVRCPRRCPASGVAVVVDDGHRRFLSGTTSSESDFPEIWKNQINSRNFFGFPDFYFWVLPAQTQLNQVLRCTLDSLLQEGYNRLQQLIPLQHWDPPAGLKNVFYSTISITTILYFYSTTSICFSTIFFFPLINHPMSTTVTIS